MPKTLKQAFQEQRDVAINSKAMYLVQKAMHDGLDPEDISFYQNQDGSTSQKKRKDIIKGIDTQLEGIDLIISKIDKLLEEHGK